MGSALSINKGLSCLRIILARYWRSVSQFTAVRTPIALPSDFLIAHRGDILHNRYRIHVKLGGGVYSNTYLVTDEQNLEKAPFFAVKVLTRDATVDCLGPKKRMLEIETMRKLRESGEHDTLPRLREVFEIRERDAPAHICLAMDVLGSDLGSFRRSSPSKALPHYTVRIIVRQIVDALVHLHDIGIVHTDIKPDNVLFHTPMGPDGISDWLRDVLSSQDDFDVSRPLPNHPSLTWNCSLDVAKRIKVTLVDLGQAQWSGKPTTVDQFSAFSLRAPETILQSDFTPKIDVWAVGCMMFELLVGRWLFHPVDGGDDWTLEDDHLAKMVEFTGEIFPREMIARARLGPNYFDSEGNLLRVTEFFRMPLETALDSYKTLSAEQIQPAAEFIGACIHLDPGARPTARQVAEHPWLQI